MILLDVTTTSHCLAHTGIQRVARSLYRELSQISDVTPICFDPYADCWRELDKREFGLMEPPKHSNLRRRRGARWSMSQMIGGYSRRVFSKQKKLSGRYSALVVPEIFDHTVAKAYDRLFPLVEGPKIAFFHDIIPVKLKHLTPAGTVRQFPQYLENLKKFDLILTNSNHTCSELLSYWKAHDETHPPVSALPLGVDIPAVKVKAADTISSGPVEILSVGTLECRKNHLTLLAAAEWLFFKGLDFRLTVIGMVNRETGQAALDRIEQLSKSGLPVEWKGAVSESVLVDAYQSCDFTVYPSLEEGFGLPVAESLSYGKPCVCANRGALQEVAEGGGCLVVDTSSVEALARGMEKLIISRSKLQQYQREAFQRSLKTWREFTQELLTHVEPQREAVLDNKRSVAPSMQSLKNGSEVQPVRV